MVFMAPMEASSGCFSLKLGNFVRSFLQFVAALLDFPCQGATFLDQLPKSIPRDVGATGTELFPDGVKIVAK